MPTRGRDCGRHASGQWHNCAAPLHATAPAARATHRAAKERSPGPRIQSPSPRAQHAQTSGRLMWRQTTPAGVDRRCATHRQALVGDQQHPITGLFQQGIGGHGGAEAELLDAAFGDGHPGARSRSSRMASPLDHRPLGLNRKHLAHLQTPWTTATTSVKVPPRSTQNCQAISPWRPIHPEPNASDVATNSPAAARWALPQQLLQDRRFAAAGHHQMNLGGFKNLLQPKGDGGLGHPLRVTTEETRVLRPVAAESWTTRQPICATGGSLNPRPLLPNPSNCSPRHQQLQALLIRLRRGTGSATSAQAGVTLGAKTRADPNASACGAVPGSPALKPT